MAENEWACPTCTFLNPMNRVYCEMCASPNPNMTSLNSLGGFSDLFSTTSLYGNPSGVSGMSSGGSQGDASTSERAVSGLRQAEQLIMLAALGNAVRSGDYMDAPSSSSSSHALSDAPAFDVSSAENEALTVVAAAESADGEDNVWRRSLVVGDMVDGKHTASRTFYIAQIAEVEGDMLEIRFLEWDEEWNRRVSRYSPDIVRPNTQSSVEDDYGASSSSSSSGSSMNLLKQLLGVSSPSSSSFGFGSALNSSASATRSELVDKDELKTEEKNWRTGLCEGSCLDALDTARQWYAAQVLEVKKSFEQEQEDELKREGVDGGEPGDMLLIRFVEWGERWNAWYNRWSNRLAEPMSKSKTRGDQDPSTIRLRATLPDYSNIKVDPDENCITHKPTPMPAGKGRMIRVRMPRDNSCLFHGISYLCEGRKTGRDHMLRQRLRCAESVMKDQDKYTDVFLGGLSTLRYCDRMKTLDTWGGAIELNVLSEFFKIEIISFDIAGSRKGPMVYRFPAAGHGFTKRVFLVYNLNHYDTIAFVPSKDSKKAVQETDNEEGKRDFSAPSPQLGVNNGEIREFFAVGDVHAMQMARKHIELLHMAHFRKGFADPVIWSGLSKEEQSELDAALPVIVRQASEPNDMDAAPSPNPPFVRSVSEPER